MAAAAAPPRVHSAIVERLRARIAVCRQHHLTCEGRYERGRAESSDRERENTLQLLNLVQHGQAARKGSKHSKAAAAAGTAGGSSSAAAASANAAAPPAADYYPQQLISNGSAGGRNGINGEQPSAVAGGEPRNPALIAVSFVVLSLFLTVSAPSVQPKAKDLLSVDFSFFLSFFKWRFGCLTMPILAPVSKFILFIYLHPAFIVIVTVLVVHLESQWTIP